MKKEPLAESSELRNAREVSEYYTKKAHSVRKYGGVAVLARIVFGLTRVYEERLRAWQEFSRTNRVEPWMGATDGWNVLERYTEAEKKLRDKRYELKTKLAGLVKEGY